MMRVLLDLRQCKNEKVLDIKMHTDDGSIEEDQLNQDIEALKGIKETLVNK